MLKGEISNQPSQSIIVDFDLLFAKPEKKIPRFYNFLGRKLGLWGLAYRDWYVTADASMMLEKVAKKCVSVIILSDEPDDAREVLEQKMRNEFYMRLFFVHSPGQYLRVMQMFNALGAFGNMMRNRWGASDTRVVHVDDCVSVLSAISQF